MFVVYQNDDCIFITLTCLEKKLREDMKDWGYDIKEFDIEELTGDSVLITSSIYVS